MLDVVLVLALSAVGAGAIAGGKTALGVLALVMALVFATEAALRRWGSDRALLRAVMFRPFFIGGWLLALVGVEVASRTTYDWVVALPLGIAYLVLGVIVFVGMRRLHRRAEH